MLERSEASGRGVWVHKDDHLLTQILRLRLKNDKKAHIQGLIEDGEPVPDGDDTLTAVVKVAA